MAPGQPNHRTLDQWWKVRMLAGWDHQKPQITGLRHCREKAEALRVKYGLQQMNQSSRPGPASHRVRACWSGRHASPELSATDL